MPYYFFVWTPEIIEHLAEHDVTQEEFEEVVSPPEFEDISRSSGDPVVFGPTSNKIADTLLLREDYTD